MFCLVQKSNNPNLALQQRKKQRERFTQEKTHHMIIIYYHYYRNKTYNLLFSFEVSSKQKIPETIMITKRCLLNAHKHTTNTLRVATSVLLGF